MDRLFALLLSLINASLALGAPEPDTFPYSNRVLPYSVRGITVLGDLGYVGMGGAAVGAPDSMVGALDNPAGLALTLTRPGLLLNAQNYRDDQIQPVDQRLVAQNVLTAWTPYPWGFGMSIWTPYTEGGRYFSPINGREYDVSLRMTEYLFSISRVFWKSKVSLGASFGVASLSRDWEEVGTFEAERSDVYAPALTLGFIGQAKHRLMIGGSVSAPIHFRSQTDSVISETMNGFHQSGYSPIQYRFGVGWVPNRLFSISIALYSMGPFRSSALLSDQTRLFKSEWIPQLRTGLRYRWLEIHNLSSEVYLGFYTESSRLRDEAFRSHGTGGIEVNPWILRLGFGFDLASGYRNLIASAGVDFPQLLIRLGLVDPIWRPKPAGVFRSPARLSEEGLPAGMSSGRIRQIRTRINLMKEGKALPERARESLKELPDTLLNAGEEVLELLEKIPQAVLPDEPENVNDSGSSEALEPDL